MCILTWPLLGRLAYVPDEVSINGRFEAERPRLRLGPPSGGRAAFMTLVHPLYSTRPHGLVQAIFWYTCPDLDLGPWYSLTILDPHCTSARSWPSPPLYSHLIGLRAFGPCVKSCLVGGSDKYHTWNCVQTINSYTWNHLKQMSSNIYFNSYTWNHLQTNEL